MTKTKRRVMTKGVLQEISAVDRPAQSHARVVLRKRDDSDPNLANAPLPAGAEASQLPAGQTNMTEQEILALRKRAERAEAIASLSVAERELFSKMNGAQQDEFLTQSPSQRFDTVQKAANANPVVYTDKKGREFRKNDDPRLVELAKDADESRARQEASEKLQKMERIAKRAGELSHLPGKPEERTLLVEAIEKMDATQQDTLLAMLKNVDTQFAKAFETAGTRNSPAPTGGTAEAQLEALAKSVRDKEPKLTEVQAYTKALESAEGKVLYAKHLEERHNAG